MVVTEYARELSLAFAAALGMVVGGSLAGALIVLLTGGLPLDTMAALAQRLKLWSTVAAVGGALVTFQLLESGIVQGELNTLLRQLLLIGVAFAGSHLGTVLILAAAGK